LKDGGEVTAGLGHGVDVARRAGYRLGQHAAVEVEDAGGDIAAFTHDGAEARAHQCLGLFLDDGEQAVPHDLPFDRGRLVCLDHGLVSLRRLNYSRGGS
jgi:hypothetical protein